MPQIMAPMAVSWGCPVSTCCVCRQELDTTITDVVYLDIGYCPAGYDPNRLLGDKAVCKSTDALGRVIIGE